MIVAINLEIWHFHFEYSELYLYVEYMYIIIRIRVVGNQMSLRIDASRNWLMAGWNFQTNKQKWVLTSIAYQTRIRLCRKIDCYFNGQPDFLKQILKRKVQLRSILSLVTETRLARIFWPFLPRVRSRIFCFSIKARPRHNVLVCSLPRLRFDNYEYFDEIRVYVFSVKLKCASIVKL